MATSDSEPDEGTTKRDQRALQTRDSLLSAGLEILYEQPTGKAFSHVSANAVSGRAGVTIGAFYHHFPTQAAYLDALFDRMYHRGLGAGGIDEALDVVGQVAAAGGSFGDAIQAGILANLEALDPNGLFRAAQVMLLGDPPGLQSDEIRRVMIGRHERTAEAYEGMRVALGREWREPFDAGAVSALVAAMLEGAATRKVALGGDAELPHEVVAWAVCALIPLITREPHETADAAQWVADNVPDWSSDI